MKQEEKSPDTKALNWGKLDELSDSQLAALVESAIFVLRRGDDPGAAAPNDMPAGAMTKALEKLLTDRGGDPSDADRVVRQPQLSRPVAILLLQEIGTEPALAQEVERVWRERSGLLVVGTGVILSAALLLLVLKLKKIRVTKDSKEIDFDRLSAGALGTLFKFLGR